MGILDKLRGSKVLAKQVAKGIDKQELLDDLKSNWATLVSSTSDVDQEVAKAMERVRKSGFEEVFKIVGITSEDLRQVVIEIQENKPKPIVNPPSIGRNSPCPCGSGKKYKRCCSA